MISLRRYLSDLLFSCCSIELRREKLKTEAGGEGDSDTRQFVMRAKLSLAVFQKYQNGPHNIPGVCFRRKGALPSVTVA